jgi:hypothetical protein
VTLLLTARCVYPGNGRRYSQYAKCLRSRLLFAAGFADYPLGGTDATAATRGALKVPFLFSSRADRKSAGERYVRALRLCPIRRRTYPRLLPRRTSLRLPAAIGAMTALRAQAGVLLARANACDSRRGFREGRYDGCANAFDSAHATARFVDAAAILTDRRRGSHKYSF